MRKLNEECGVFGIYGHPDAAKMTYYGLYALQHRGQESCGIAVNDDGNIKLVRDMGLVNEVFNTGNMAGMTGNIAIGHVRYAVQSEANRENAQPLVSRYVKGSLSMAYNGCLLNAGDLRGNLESKGAIFHCTNDAEVIMHLLAIARTRTHSIEESAEEVMNKLAGAYSIVLMSPRKMLGMRDPNGFRPLCIGTLGDSYILASESSAFDVIGASFLRDVNPGEIVLIDGQGLHSIMPVKKRKPSLCVFEYVYFARPDSVIDGVSVYDARLAAGKLLAKAHPVAADIVIGVPDSGLTFAAGYAEGSGIPLRDGFIKNRYTGRTFIKPKQSEREMAVSIKLNVLKTNVAGKRVVMVDDSIVRGTTCSNIIKALKKAGAKEVHMRVASPAFLWPCYFGTDIPQRKDLIAVSMTLEQIRERIGADTLAYLPLKDIPNMALRSDFGYCTACFDGKTPIKIPPHMVIN